MKRLYVLICGCLMFPALHAASTAEAQALLNKSPPQVEATASKRPNFRGASTNCLVTPSIEVDLASPVAGVIAQAYAKRGDFVKEGETVARLRSEVEDATFKLNEAKAAYGRRTIERNVSLFEKKLISAQERDDVIFNNQIYENEERQTRAVLDQKTIKSPIAGFVLDTYIDVGEYVGDKPILKIVQLDPLYVDVAMPASMVGKVRTGMTAWVDLAPVAARRRATVIVVDRVFDAASGTFGIRLKLDNPDSSLPAGVNCHVSF